MKAESKQLDDESHWSEESMKDSKLNHELAVFLEEEEDDKNLEMEIDFELQEEDAICRLLRREDLRNRSKIRSQIPCF